MAISQENRGVRGGQRKTPNSEENHGFGPPDAHFPIKSVTPDVHFEKILISVAKNGFSAPGLQIWF